jgi:hypothetical protein
MGRSVSVSLRNYATVFQAKAYAILECVYEIPMNPRPEISALIVRQLCKPYTMPKQCLHRATVPKGIE